MGHLTWNIRRENSDRSLELAFPPHVPFLDKISCSTSSSLPFPKIIFQLFAVQIQIILLFIYFLF